MPESVRLVDRLRQISPTLSVGVLTADWMALGVDLASIEKAGVSLLHFDVMDGCFCPMLTMGPPVIKAIKTSLFKDVHLVVEEPLDKLEGYVAAGADMVTVHIEACRNPHRVLQVLAQMKNVNDPVRGIVRGMALNPGTPVDAVEPLLDELDVVFLLAVNPGWGGQKFIASTERRVKSLLDLVRRNGRDILVGVDGGITRDNVGQVARMGADLIVTGRAVFDGKNASGNARSMLDEVARSRR